MKPAVLTAKQLAPWLAGKASVELLRPASENVLQMWPVSRKANRVGNDNDAKQIEALQ